MTRDERKALKPFLDRLLDGRYTPSESRGLMNRSAQGVRFSSKGAVSLLTAIRAHLDDPD